MPGWRNWLTRGTQNAVTARSCGFDSHSRHNFMLKTKLSDKNFEWSPKLAYIIGLITTDGNLSKDERHMDFTSKDLQLINLFKNCLKLKNKIGLKSSGFSDKKYLRIQFGNVVFYRWLQGLGLTPHKSKTIGALKIPDKYFPDFLRGHLDGDGSIITYKDHWNTFKNPKYIYTRLWVKFISVSKIHIEWLRENIIRLLSIKGFFIQDKIHQSHQTVGMCGLKFGKKESIKLLSWLYYNKNVPCLIRKRKIAEKFI